MFRTSSLVSSPTAKVRRFDAAIDAVPRNFNLESPIRNLERNAMLPCAVSIVSVEFPNKAFVGGNLCVTGLVTLVPVAL
jgi:hypothetical protein